MDNVISQDNTFSYKYSAVENKEIQEIQEIRKRYLPQSENKLEELKLQKNYIKSKNNKYKFKGEQNNGRIFKESISGHEGKCKGTA